MPLQIRVMAGKLGDIFWDLGSWIVYYPGFDLGCTIYVANHTDTEKEYALMARLFRDGALLIEEALPVYGHTWFTVAAGDFIRLFGAFRYDETGVILEVSLVERETEEATDSVSTILVSPEAAVLPPAWPVAPGVYGADWLSLMMPLMMMAMLGMIMASAFRPEKEKIIVASPEEIRRLLPPEEARKLLSPGGTE